MRNITVLGIDKQLGYAHMALWRAAKEAESLSNQGLTDDLYAIAMEVGRIHVDLLKRKGYSPKRTVPRA